MDSRPYNIVLLPPSVVNNQVIKLSKLLSKKYKTEFIVDGKNKFPHATLYQLEVPKKNLEKLYKSLEEKWPENTLLPWLKKLVDRLDDLQS